MLISKPSDLFSTDTHPSHALATSPQISLIFCGKQTQYKVLVKRRIKRPIQTLVPALMVCPLMAGQVTALVWSLAKEGLVQSLGCGFGAFWADPKGERMCVRGCRAALPAEERVSCV